MHLFKPFTHTTHQIRPAILHGMKASPGEEISVAAMTEHRGDSAKTEIMLDEAENTGA